MGWCCCASRFLARSALIGRFVNTFTTGRSSIRRRRISSVKCESEGGEDLSWFWRGWYLNNWKYDVAAEKIDGATVTLSNRGQLVLPTTVEATFTDGTKTRVRLPVETWMSKGTYTWTPDSKRQIASVVVDPDHQLPDDDRGNNSVKAP